MRPGFLVHSDDDHVGVAVRDLRAGERAEGISLTSQHAVHVTVLAEIPLGHKVALKNLNAGEPLLKYGEVVGVVTAPIHVGDHVHIHNLTSRRWGSS